MIKVQGKTLEVGDTVKFRCGAIATVETIKYYEPTYIQFKEDLYYSFLDDGTANNNGKFMDIIDIIKAEAVVKDAWYNIWCKDNIPPVLGGRYFTNKEMAIKEEATGLISNGLIHLTYNATTKEILSCELDKPDNNDGWIEWNGGKQPIDNKNKVEVKFRDGTINSQYTATCWVWKHDDNDKDIIAYRVIKE